MADTLFLESDLKERPATDIEIRFWPALLLSLITFGIYSYVVIWRLVSRRDRHFRRIARLTEDAGVYLRDRGADEGVDVEGVLTRLKRVERSTRLYAYERGATLWTLLVFLAGIALWVLWYVLMDDFQKHEEDEETIVSAINHGLGLLGQEANLTYERQVPARRFWEFMILTLITFGIYGIYWLYCMVEDGNRHFRAQAEWETQLAAAIAAATPTAAPTAASTGPAAPPPAPLPGPTDAPPAAPAEGETIG